MSPARVSLPDPFWTYCLLRHKRASGPGPVLDIPSMPAGCRKDGAGGNKNQYIFMAGAGGVGCAEAAGRGSANESKPGLWLVREVWYPQRSREGGDAGGRIKR